MKSLREFYVILAFIILVVITSDISYAADTQSLDEYLSQCVKGKLSSDIAGFNNLRSFSKEVGY